MKRTQLRFLAGIAMVVMLLATPEVSQARQTMLVEVQAGSHDRRNVPLSVTLPEDLASAKHLWMQQLDSGQPIPVQRSAHDPSQLFWIMRDTLSARQSRRFRISASEFDRNRELHVAVKEDGEALTVLLRGKPVLVYHTAVVTPPTGVDPIFRRSGFIHPLQTPSGRVLTEAFPEDHLHQHGVFNAWVKTTYDGREVDFWNQKAGTGTVEHVEVTSVGSGPVFGEFSTKLRHLDLSAGDEPVTVLDETWTVRVYDMADRYVIDLESAQQCATDKPLLLQEFHYGGMAFRGTSEWLGQQESDFLTSEGLSRADGNHSRPQWTDAFGIVGSQPCGVAVLQHPLNVRFPAPVRLHPEKPYFVYTPVALGEMAIEPEQTLTSRFRYITHDGPPESRSISAAWLDYGEPPVVKILE